MSKIYSSFTGNRNKLYHPLLKNYIYKGYELALPSLEYDEIEYINYICYNLENYGILSKIDVLYPFVGKNSVWHSLNLINPESFQITWFNNPIHTKFGLELNGINQYGNTNWTDSVDGTLGSISASVYTRNDVSSNKMIMGGVSTGTGTTSLQFYYFSGTLFTSIQSASEGNYLTATTKGYLLNTRTGSDYYHYSNGILKATSLGGVANQTTVSYFLGAYNLIGSPAFYADTTINFCHIGKYINSTEQLILNEIIHNAQGILNRQFI